MSSAVVDPMPVSSKRLWTAFLRAEWIKLRTVRSTAVTLTVGFLTAVGFGALACQRFAAQFAGLSGSARTDVLHHKFLIGFDPTNQSLIGNAVAQLAIGTLGVLFVTSEFGTGMIRASVLAMPQRPRWVAAKVAVFGAVAVVAGQLLTFTSFWVGQAVLASNHLGASISDPGVLRSVVVTGLYVSLVGVLGACFGLIIKHTAGAITTLIAALYVIPVLLQVFPESFRSHALRFLPNSIGEQAATIVPLSDHFSPWAGIGMMAVYAAVLFTLGSMLVQRRDA